MTRLGRLGDCWEQGLGPPAAAGPRHAGAAGLPRGQESLIHCSVVGGYFLEQELGLRFERLDGLGSLRHNGIDLLETLPVALRSLEHKLVDVDDLCLCCAYCAAAAEGILFEPRNLAPADFELRLQPSDDVTADGWRHAS